MSYLALARKWRPKKFADVAGQDHIVRALVNALEGERVHHAYLFAGTRGVGKTTVARILAKALNCEAGVNAEPCCECSACLSIDQGRFVDLIEVDAASRTKVDDTRELLENVQYTPAAGRYKVYLIDEVHMLSNHSFNALLKTLEEPPPHVKFLLATTDPQKLPVTVLSRCLQFNLKRLPVSLIVDRMRTICAAENIDTDQAALMRIARAAAGSMRDALSLLDQAVAFGGGALRDAEVAEMLGSMDQRHISELLQCLAAGDATALLGQIRVLQALVPDYELVLDDLAIVLQQVAVAQLAGTESLGEDADVELISEFATRLDAELVQLYYQIAITGRRDLHLAPDPRIGFEMTLLRMLAFQPAARSGPDANFAGKASRSAAAVATPKDASRRGGAPATISPAAVDADWHAVINRVQFKGAVRQLAENCVLESRSAGEMKLALHRRNECLLTDHLQQQMLKSLQDAYGKNLRVTFNVVDSNIQTIATVVADESVAKLESAKDSIQNDPKVQELIEMFGAKIDDGSVQPVAGSGSVEQARKH
jgi:DNA polymerase-3 subunit gamma/tau